jgi:methionine biosynthesis protein MetW
MTVEEKQSSHLEATRRYYDAFSARYDAHRGGRIPGGYHDLLDDLELEFLERYVQGSEVLEVGCGTGLLLERMQAFSRRAEGVDLSPGMLARARERGLTVVEGSATELPFADDSFDVVCSFKVLSHVRDIERALAEMVRVSRRFVVAEFYNRHSLRSLVKWLGPAGAISHDTREDAVYTRYDTPDEVARMLPPVARLVASRGVRIVTPAAMAMRVPVLRDVLALAERTLCDSPMARFGGFWIAAIEKESSARG